jgi:Male sterility protein
MVEVGSPLTLESASASVAIMKDLITSQLDALADSESRTAARRTIGGVPTQDEKRAVLVTGTTGALGCYLLETLLLDPSVDEVFALNRCSRSAHVEWGHTRQITAFQKRGINQGLLESTKLTFVDADRVEDIEREVISRVCSLSIFFSSLSPSTDGNRGIK